MRTRISLSIFFLAVFETQSAQAQPPICSRDLRWGDATYVQRTTRIGGHVTKADVETFSNATVTHVEIDDVPAAVIRLKASDQPDDIYLTFGADRPKPFEFAEIGMVLELPMSDGTWSRFSKPCVIEDGVSVYFDESDIPRSINSDAGKLPKFHGTLKRSGLRIDYSMMVEDDQTSDGGVMTWDGMWKYSRELKVFSVETDVQGWHVYRANAYLLTLPVGAPISLAAALKQVANTSPKTFK